MKRHGLNSLLALALLAGLATTGVLEAQEPPIPEELPESEIQEDLPPPAHLARAELERSRMCVPGMAQLQAVSERLQPLRERLERIEALHRAVALEDPERVAPLDDGSPLEASVQAWFQADEEMGRRYAASEDDAVLEERAERKQAMLGELEEAHEGLGAQVQGIVESADGLGMAIRHCEGAIFIRDAVREACQEGNGPLCRALQDEGQLPGLRFVDNAEDLWGIEHLRPWNEPTRLRPSPDGTLAGARTGSLVRRGNLTVFVAFQALIRPRATMSEEDQARLDDTLAAMGFEFDHPDFVMTPGLSVEADVMEALDEETHYFLHFGDLSDPEEDVIWAFFAGTGGPIGSRFALEEQPLLRLAQGEPLSFTAIRLPEEGSGEGEALWSLPVSNLAQSQAVLSLLQYMADGRLSQDLASLVPPGS